MSKIFGSNNVRDEENLTCLEKQASLTAFWKFSVPLLTSVRSRAIERLRTETHYKDQNMFWGPICMQVNKENVIE